MANKMRVSQHSGRVGSPAHNDRSFLRGRDEQEAQEMAPHIRVDDTLHNVTWCVGGEKDFRAAELAYYREHYGAAIEATNQRYREQGHPERCKTVEQVYTGKLTRPEEMIIQIGDRDAGVDPSEFAKCVNDYLGEILRWDREHGGRMHILNVAVHLDEASPHAHIRRVWDYTDKDGMTRLGQGKALQAAGVPLPHPDKPTGRYNNRKITYDQMARSMWQEIARSHGYDIETEPRAGIRHKDKADYIDGRIQQQREQQEQLSKELAYQIRDQQDQLDALRSAEAQAKHDALAAMRDCDEQQATLEVIQALCETAEAVRSTGAPEVDILATAPAKRHLGGRTTPETVTIAREDYDRLRSDATQTLQTMMAADRIIPSVKMIIRSAQKIHTNRMDAFAAALDERTKSLTQEVEQLQHDNQQIRDAKQRIHDDLIRERGTSADLRQQLADAKEILADWEQLYAMYPNSIDQLRSQRAQDLSRQQERERSISRGRSR